jgi:hypothetical protein
VWSDKIKPYQLVLSDKNGEANLFISREWEQISALPDKKVIPRAHSSLFFLLILKIFKPST